MVQAHRRTIILTGAPLPTSLTWQERELCAPFGECFLEAQRQSASGEIASRSNLASWRLLAFEPTHLPSGLTQAGRELSPFAASSVATETSFFTTPNASFVSAGSGGDPSHDSLGSGEENGEILSQYYEHSFAVYDDVPLSHILDAASPQNASLASESEEYSPTFIAENEIDSEGQVARSRLASGNLSRLKEIPDAAYLRSINPQTMTVNLVVGIISVSKPRTIVTRRNARTVELVELLVGDDTRAGFGINIWLPTPNERHYPDPREKDLRASTLQFRPRDIILARSVALNSFRGKVYGQSLRRGLTTLDLLYRRTVDEYDKRGAYDARDLEEAEISNPQIPAVKGVQDWIMQFVGNGVVPERTTNRSVGNLRGKQQLAELPMDTQ